MTDKKEPVFQSRNIDKSDYKFDRDAEMLFHKYFNLRMRLFNTYKNQLWDNSYTQKSDNGKVAYNPDQIELMEYIDEQFIKLVKEYDITSGVDFPGYVKKKLEMRTRNTFVKSKLRDRERERIPSSENWIRDTLDDESVNASTFSERELLEDMDEDLEFTDLEKDMIQSGLFFVRDAKVLDSVSDYGKRDELRPIMENLKTRIRDYLIDNQYVTPNDDYTHLVRELFKPLNLSDLDRDIIYQKFYLVKTDKEITETLSDKYDEEEVREGLMDIQDYISLQHDLGNDTYKKLADKTRELSEKNIYKNQKQTYQEILDGKSDSELIREGTKEQKIKKIKDKIKDGIYCQ